MKIKYDYNEKVILLKPVLIPKPLGHSWRRLRGRSHLYMKINTLSNMYV